MTKSFSEQVGDIFEAAADIGSRGEPDGRADDWWADEPIPFTVEDPRTVEVKIHGAA